MALSTGFATPRLSWRKGLLELFRKDVSTEEHTPQHYLKLARKCMESAEKMTSQGGSTSLHFNHAQCEYLANKLKEAVEGAEIWGLPTPVEMNLAGVDVMRLLWRCAMGVEIFILDCCRDDWIHAAMLLANTTEQVSQLSADMEFCTLLVRNRFNPLAEVLPEFESGLFYQPKSVKEIVSRDQRALLTKLEVTKSSKTTVDHKTGNRRQLSEPESQLAKCLASRLLQHLLGSVQLSVWEIQYSKLRPGLRLGAGASGWVRKSTWMGEEVAEKAFQGSDHESFKNEVKILAGLAHPNIVPLFGYAEEKNKCFILMELMDGDLSSLMEERMRKSHTCKAPFTLFESVDIMLQTAEGMLYLHEHNVVHRDLKSHNILVKSRKNFDVEYVYAKVADFGLSKTKEASSSYSKLTENMGTTRWMAPELLPPGEDDLCARTSNHDPEPNYPFKVDIYSFGMVCFEILTGEVPFSSVSSHKDVKKMVLVGDRPELPDDCSDVLKSLISSCWKAEPSHRPPFAEICKRLRFLKYSIMRGSGTLPRNDPVAIFEAIRLLTSTFTKMEAINGSRTMFRARMRDGFAAVKKFKEVWGSYEKRKIREQVLRLSKLDHKNVLKTIGCWLEGHVKVVAYEYSALGSLHDVLRGKVVNGQNAPLLTWKQRIKIALGIARGLAFLHGQNPLIIHGNIKSSNILMFDENVAKIGDFEFTPMERYKFPGIEIRAPWAVNTRIPCAPELNETGKKCSQESDIYAIGVLLLELLTGEDVDDYKIAKAIQRKITPDRIDHSIGDQRVSKKYRGEGFTKMAEIAARCLQFGPQYRPSALDLVETLQPLLRVRRA